MPYATLAGLENGDQKNSLHLPEIAKVLWCNLDWLVTGLGPIEYGDEDDAFVNVAGASLPVSSGGGTEDDPNAEAGRLKFRRESLIGKELDVRRLRVYYSRADSMEPAINDGSAVMYDTSKKKPEDDTVFVVWYENRLFVKRLRVPTRDGDIFIESDNKVGKWRKLIAVTPGDNFMIEGKVVWLANWFQV